MVCLKKKNSKAKIGVLVFNIILKSYQKVFAQYIAIVLAIAKVEI